MAGVQSIFYSRVTDQMFISIRQSTTEDSSRKLSLIFSLHPTDESICYIDSMILSHLRCGVEHQLSGSLREVGKRMCAT